MSRTYCLKNNELTFVEQLAFPKVNCILQDVILKTEGKMELRHCFLIK